MKALAGRTPEQAARELLMAESRELVGLLLKAAKGEPPFEDLPADKRLTALQRCLEYSLGRPTPGPKVEAEKQDDGPGLVME